MNQSQIKHLKHRLSEIRNQKMNKVRDQLWSTSQERETEFANGRYEIEGQNGDYKLVYPRLVDKQMKAKEKQTLIENEYQRLMDEVILGDAQEALEALNNFRQMEV